MGWFLAFLLFSGIASCGGYEGLYLAPLKGRTEPGTEGPLRAPVDRSPRCHRALFDPLSFPTGDAGQAIQVIGDRIYLLFNGGVILELDSDLQETWRGTFSVGERILIPKPVGMTRPDLFPDEPTLIGGLGSFHEIDWGLFREEGNLDHAYLRTIPDPFNPDAYCRAEYVRIEGKTYLASSRHHTDPEDRPNVNEIRLYDVERLKGAGSTAEEGVLAYRIADGPQFIQSMAWQDPYLVLVRDGDHTIPGFEWHLTLLKLPSGERVEDICYSYDSELEGWNRLPDGRELFLTGDLEDNFFVTQGQ